MIEEIYHKLIPDNMRDECLEYSKTDNFIGSKFGKDEVIEVLGWFGEKVNKHVKVYLVKCHECAKDPELNGDGIFRSLKDNLKKGRIPCKCNTNKGLTSKQLSILLKRKLENTEYTFVDFIENSNLDEHSAVLSCSKHGDFKVESAYRFIKLNQTCPQCTKEKMYDIFKKDEDHFIKSFFDTGKFHKDTIFKLSSKTYKANGTVKNYWEYTCPICSNDEYVQNGLCSGVFLGRSSNLQQGNMPCRCSKIYKWNTKQREFQVNSIIKDSKLDVSFIGWLKPEKYIGYKSRIVLNCNIHGNYDIAIDNFLQGYHRCPICSGRGYSKFSTGYFYIVKWYSENLSFYKLGISNSPEMRFKRQLSKNKLNHEVYKLYKFEDGSYPLEIESFCKSNFNVGVIGFDIMPDGYTETFNVEDLEKIENYVKSFKGLYTEI